MDPNSPCTPVRDYALLADRHTAALVSRAGSIDWMCLPRFDSPAVFAALLGVPDNGRWVMAVAGGEVVERRYEPDTFVLVTRWRTPDGEAVTTEFMPQDHAHTNVVRHVECTAGRVVVEHELTLRFRYGRSLPWVRRAEDAAGVEALVAISGPDGVVLHGPDLAPDGAHHSRSIPLVAGEGLCWQLQWFPSHEVAPAAADPGDLLARTRTEWREWSQAIIGDEHRQAIRRSLLVLRALTHHETGGIVAAPTTSLPEFFGGARNWDYRYVWLRDSALTMQVMLEHGLVEPNWRDWLLRAVASDHDDLQILYGVSGERVDEERTLPHLRGYGGSTPVRVGNAAAGQYQADVIGEVMLALQGMRRAGIAEDRYSWSLQRILLNDTIRRVHREDCGIWEVRGRPRFFTQGRVMMWAAFDCGVRAVEEYGFEGEADQWRATRDRLREEVEARGWNARLNSFTQTYDNDEVDASLLVLPHTGFLAPDDPRMLGTVARIEADLVDEHGFVRRYRTDRGVDGLGGEPEYPFLICSAWLAIQYACTGRIVEAEEIFHRLVDLGGDLHLLSEEYDPQTGRLAGNYPQAFSHLGLAQAAIALDRAASGCSRFSTAR